MRPRFSAANPAAEKVRVLYTSESVIYEGMPVCYDYDATLNIDGYDNTDGAGITTDEGHQNEGKFNRVEAVSASNLAHFAGVVAGSDKHGVTGDGAVWLDIYVPNGAIVPVRCDVDTTTGVTILAITSASQELGFIVADSRPVAIAMEDETVLDSGGADITLAKLDPSLFSFNYGTSSSAYAVTPGNYPLNCQYVEFSNVAASLSFLQDNRLLYNVALASGQITVENNYLHFTGSSIAAGATYIRCVVNNVDLDGCILNGAGLIIAGAFTQLGGTPAANTAVNFICASWDDVTVGVAPTAGNYYITRKSNNGAATIDAIWSLYPAQCNNIFKFEHIPDAGANPIVKMTGDHTFDANDYALKVDLDGDTFYIPVIDALN